MNNANEKRNEIREYLTINEVSNLTRRTVRYLYKLKHEGKIPFVQRCNGGKLLFVKSEIIAWMNGEYQNQSITDDAQIEKDVLTYVLNTRKKAR